MMQLDNIVELDILLPAQYLGLRRSRAPEHRLMAAVVENALQCIEKYRSASDPRRRRLFNEAKLWFLAREPDWPYSFECICEALDLDSDAVRQHLGVSSTDAPTSPPNGGDEG